MLIVPEMKLEIVCDADNQECLPTECKLGVTPHQLQDFFELFIVIHNGGVPG